MIEIAEPEVLPKPITTPKTRPNKNDPWTVPAPKVNPTPKAEVYDNKKEID